MTYKIFITLFILALPTWLLAQSNTDGNDDWVINEVYASDSSSRYGLFVELYNPKGKKSLPDFFLSDDKTNPYQFRLRTIAPYKPDIRLQRGYKTFRVSVLRFKRKSIKIYGKPDSLYLFSREGNEFRLKDSFPIIWSDSLSTGRCKNKICQFNISTPGRENKNVETSQYMSRRNYRVSLFGGLGSANNTGSDNAGRIPSYGVRVQKIVNRRFFYTGTSAAIFRQGYSFKGIVDSTSNYIVSNDGKDFTFQLWVGKDVGLYLTPRIDISCSAALVLFSDHRQKYSLTTVTNGERYKERMNENPANYGLPVLTFNTGLSYQISSSLKIEFFHNVLFRTFEKNETIYYHSFNIGLSSSFRARGRAYRESLLW